MVDPTIRERARGCAVGAACGDALGMPLEFGPPRPAGQLLREMQAGRLPAGSFTDDTEMALALAESLLAQCPLDPADLAARFVAWYRAGPADVGVHTHSVLTRIGSGAHGEEAARAVQRSRPDSAGNGSVMRCWPAALAHWDDLDRLIDDSRLQSRVTHPHPECQAGSAFVNTVLFYLLHGVPPRKAVLRARRALHLPEDLQEAIETAPQRPRHELKNSGWVRHTLESAVWGLLSTNSFEEAVVQVANLGGDADTAAAVTGALAGAAYGLEGIPSTWRQQLHGEWPLGSGRVWRAPDLVDLADALTKLSLLA